MKHLDFLRCKLSSAARFSSRAAVFFCATALLFFAAALNAPAQTNGKAPRKAAAQREPNAAANLPKIVQIDEAKLREVLKPSGRPLLVNFWATWCEPCREEFPDLVRIDLDYRGRLDVITISLDDVEEIGSSVPRFLGQMKAEMPAYLLKVPDENAVIQYVSGDWTGGLPFTILYNEKGEVSYYRQGKFKTDVLRGEIDKIVSPAAPQN